MSFRTRFAPSPTGPLHLGHAFSSIVGHDMAREAGGTFLLRMEDIDPIRSKPVWDTQIQDDLRWLGLDWDEDILRQSQRGAAYSAALERLDRLGLVYTCDCNRRDISEALSAPQEGTVKIGPDGPVYPGTCRPPNRPRSASARAALRLNMRAACDHLSKHSLTYQETGTVPDMVGGEISLDFEYLADQVGDVVLARKDFGTSFHLSVVLDDAYQDISHVVRGADLVEATVIHVVLQALLDLPTPIYHHHRLIRDAAGKRLAKRDDARSISTLRDAGETPESIRRTLNLV